MQPRQQRHEHASSPAAACVSTSMRAIDVIPMPRASAPSSQQQHCNSSSVDSLTTKVARSTSTSARCQAATACSWAAELRRDPTCGCIARQAERQLSEPQAPCHADAGHRERGEAQHHEPNQEGNTLGALWNHSGAWVHAWRLRQPGHADALGRRVRHKPGIVVFRSSGGVCFGRGVPGCGAGGLRCHHLPAAAAHLAPAGELAAHACMHACMCSTPGTTVLSLHL